MMATGFIDRVLRGGTAHSTACLLIACAAAAPAHAADITLAGTLTERGIFVVDGVTRTLRVGQAVAPGVRLVAVGRGEATIDHGDRRQTLRVGQRAGAPAGEQSALLHANPQGHFVVTGGINGQPVRFLVDTGATLIALGSSDARRLGVALAEGEPGMAHTANGTVPVTRVRLRNVRVGDIDLDGVDAMVHEHDLPVALLGMSFLNRTDMRREGTTMVLKKRY
jgi:aspartyl protease family protein